MKHLHIDFETAALLDLKKAGLHRYIEDGSFQPLCVAWKLDWHPPSIERLDDGGGLPRELYELLISEDVQTHAWNAAFEDRILRAHYKLTPGNRLSCTQQRGLAYGLPGKLEKAGRALGCQWVKDVSAHRLMLRMSRAPGAVWTPEEWKRLMDYCVRDVMSEEEISRLIPQLTPEERALSEVDRTMNNQGVWVDMDTVKLLARVARDAEQAETARATVLSGGDVTSPATQGAKMLKWLGTKGMQLPNLSRNAVEEALKAPGGDAEALEMLEIRLRVGRTSTKKLIRMREVASTGDFLRGQFQFLGAGRTGRWAGRGIQPQNLPRPGKGFSPLEFLEMAKRSTASNASLDVVAPAPILDCVSWCLRACLGAKDRMMWGFDFSQIEARVLAWLAGQQDVLNVFRSGQDVYVWAAAQFGSDDRQLGKVLILALGFGMGVVKLRETARKIYGVTMTEEEARNFKNAWRTKNAHIVKYWEEIEGAARSAIMQRGQVFGVMPSAVSLVATAKTLQMRLPSGRVLYYHAPHIEANGSITYWGTENGQWVQRRTWGGTLAENATQAAARDIMAEAMMRVAARINRIPVMTVHDELVYGLKEDDKVTAALLEGLMREAPQWAGGLPIDGEVKLMKRYGLK